MRCAKLNAADPGRKKGFRLGDDVGWRASKGEAAQQVIRDKGGRLGQNHKRLLPL